MQLLKFRKLHFSRSISAIFSWISKLVMIVWDLVCSFSEPDLWISFYESYHVSSNFAEYRYVTKFKWPYFGTAWDYSDMVRQVGSPTCIVHADVTLTPSKVKVTGFLNTQRLHFSRSIFAILAWNSKLMVDRDSMGPSLQLVRAWFSNFLLRKLSCEFKLRRMSTFTNFKWPYFRIALC